MKLFFTLLLLSILSIFIYASESYLVGENGVFRGIIAFFTIISFLILLIFFNNLNLNKMIIKSILGGLYIIFYSYITLYFSAALYGIEKFSDQTRRPYGLSIDEIAAIYQSSVGEGFQFITLSLGYWHLIIIFMVPLVITYFVYLTLKYTHPIKNHKLNMSYLLIVITSFYLILPSIPTFPKVLYAGFVRYSQQVEEMKIFAAYRQKINFNLSLNNNIKGTHILILGESANKEHMSAYGYFRDTTPWLKSKKDNENFILFENAYAPYCHTVPSLLKVLTEANQYNLMKQNQAISIIDVAKKAGFKTYWISEQHGAMIDTPLSVVINEASYIKYVNEGGEVIDAVNGVMKNIDQNKNNLIVIHLMGSHADYKQRLAGCNNIYTDIKKEEVGNLIQDEKFMKNLLNPYDSTIRCTDDRLKEIFELTAGSHDWIDSFTYLSDHGEDVFNQKFHNSADFSYPMVHVPLVMYFSDRYKKQFSDDMDRLKSHKNIIFTTDLLFNTMIDILTINYPKFEKGYSILDDNYLISDKNALTMQRSPDEDETYYTMTNKRYINDDPLYIAKKNLEYINKYFPNRFIADHCDSFAKASEVSMIGFKGVEFNIALEKFVIGHPPEYILNTSVKKYLEYQDIFNINKLWFDLKSRKVEDIGYVTEKFEELDSKLNIKQRSLIESTENGLGLLSKKGWKTAFYIKPFNYTECKTMNDICAKAIVGKIQNSGAVAISFPYIYYGFIKDKIEPLLSEQVKYYTFGLSNEYSIFSNDFIKKIQDLDVVQDKRVETILLDSSQRYHY